MKPEPHLPAKRSLLDRPQSFGFLPTWWFWNDWEAQRLLLPLALFAVPVSLVINLLQVYWGLGAWVSIVAGILISILMMGLVERYVRAQARMRRGKESVDAPRHIAGRGHGGPVLLMSMALLSGILTVLLLLQVNFVVLGIAAVSGAGFIAIRLRQSGEAAGVLRLSEAKQDEQSRQ
jgi:hypothetical protein